MSNDDLITYLVPLAVLIALGLGFFLWHTNRTARFKKRIARVTGKRKNLTVAKSADTMSLRRKSQDSQLPIIGKILTSLPTLARLNARLEMAGLTWAADNYITGCVLICIATAGVIIALNKPVILGIMAGLFFGMIIPNTVLNYLGKRRVKKFLTLFPDAIDFIVRGLRSGLPVTESMTVVATEMEEPVCSIFASVSESVKLGLSVEKSLQGAAKKLDTTEFNFFVTSIILQTETGGNLAEILSNLADVLRKRFMMRMKIKALSSEAKASAIIVGALPFVVILALSFISPTYLSPLIDDIHGNIAAAGASLSLLTGMGIMYKMTQFEI